MLKRRGVMNRLLAMLLVAALMLSPLSWLDVNAMREKGDQISSVPKTDLSGEDISTNGSRVVQGDRASGEKTDLGCDQKRGFAEDRVIVRVSGGSRIKATSDGSFFGIEVDGMDELMKLQPKSGANARAGAEYPSDSLKVITLKNKGEASVREAIKQLNQMPGIVYAEPDYVVHAAATPNDVNFNTPSMWGMKKIQAPEAWGTATGSAEVVVAVLDSGIDFRHPDLAPNIWRNPGEIEGDRIDNDGNGFVDDISGWCFNNGSLAGSDNRVFDDYGHGTHVAGTIGAAGNNGIGTAGVSWNVKLMNLKILDSYGDGYTSDIILATEYADKMNAQIINASYGGYEFSQAEKDSIDNADLLFVTAAGNDGQNNDTKPAYPANYQSANIISVANTTKLDILSSSSNYGVNTVDIAAPGSDIFSTTPLETYTVMSGTSMATPHVAGAAALVLSHNPNMTTQQLKERLLSTVDKVFSLKDKVSSGGRLNVYKALNPQAAPLPEYLPENLSPVSEFTGFDGGDGSVENPYQVSTSVQFNEVRKYNHDHFIQMKDIDMTYDTQNPKGRYYNETRGFEPFDFFYGFYDGNGHTIKGLAMKYANTSVGVGLFRSNRGWIVNLGLVDGEFVNCELGSIAGYNYGVIANCYNTGSVTGYGHFVGGLVGRNEGEIINCYNTGSVSSAAECRGFVGGIAHSDYDGSIVNSYSSGTLSAKYVQDIKDTYIGFIAGGNGSTIQNSYHTGTVSNIEGSGKGAMIGIPDEKTTVTGSYCLGQYDGERGTILTEDGMKQKSSFSGWNFDQVWNISSGSNNGYPYLRSFAPLEGIKGAEDFAGGDGTPKNPLQVSNPKQLNEVREHLSKYFIQVNDIDMTYDTQNPSGLYYHDGQGWQPIGEVDGKYMVGLAGSYNGNGHAITGLRVNRPNMESVGLFAFVSGDVHNLALLNTDISGEYYVGGIIGYLDGYLKRSYVTGSVSASTTSDYRIFGGGIVGFMSSGTIVDCYNRAKVSGFAKDMYYFGGIVGQAANAVVINCYNLGVVSGYNIGNVYNGRDGQIVGSAYQGVTSSYYWRNSEDNNGSKITEAQMKQKASYVGWDFKNIWNISSLVNNGYPYLRGVKIVERPSDAMSPTISQKPSDTAVIVGNQTTLSIVAQVGIGNLSYQWYQNTTKSNIGGNAISGAVSASYKPSTVEIGDSYFYCVITNTDDMASGKRIASVTSQAVTVSVIEPSEARSITYDKNAATGGIVPVDRTVYKKGSVLTVRGNTGKLSRTGYVFAGWTMNRNGTGTLYKSGSRITVGSGNVRLYAKWTAVIYKMTYHKNGALKGRVPVDTIRYRIGTTMTVRDNTGKLARKGYVFAGWTLNNRGTGKVYRKGNRIRVSRNMTLYAKWVRTTAKMYPSTNRVYKNRSIRIVVSGNAAIHSVRWNISNKRIASIRVGGTARRICIVKGLMKNRRVTLTATITFKDGTKKLIRRIISVR